MATTSGNDTHSAAPVSKVASHGQQELSSASTLTASTGDGFKSSGNLLEDVNAQKTLPKQSSTSRDEAIADILATQAAEANRETKNTKDNNLSKGLELDDDGDKTPPVLKRLLN